MVRRDRGGEASEAVALGRERGQVVFEQPDGVLGCDFQHPGGGGKVHAEFAQHQDVLQAKQLLFAVVAATVVAHLGGCKQADVVVMAQGAARHAGLLGRPADVDHLHDAIVEVDAASMSSPLFER